MGLRESSIKYLADLYIEGRYRCHKCNSVSFRYGAGYDEVICNGCQREVDLNLTVRDFQLKTIYTNTSTNEPNYQTKS